MLPELTVSEGESWVPTPMVTDFQVPSTHPGACVGQRFPKAMKIGAAQSGLADGQII